MFNIDDGNLCMFITNFIQPEGNLIKQLLYADKCYYYLCFLNINSGFYFKISVLSRFLTLVFKKTHLFHYFFTQQFIRSFIAFLHNLYASLLFSFKKRL